MAKALDKRRGLHRKMFRLYDVDLVSYALFVLPHHFSLTHLCCLHAFGFLFSELQNGQLVPFVIFKLLLRNTLLIHIFIFDLQNGAFKDKTTIRNHLIMVFQCVIPSALQFEFEYSKLAFRSHYVFFNLINIVKTKKS